MRRARKILAGMFAAMVIVTLAACGENSAEADSSTENTTSAQTENISETENTTETTTETEDTSDAVVEVPATIPEDDEEESSGFELPTYKMAVIESNSSFISVAIALDPSVTGFDNIQLQTSSGDVTFGRCDLDAYYVDPGEDGWYDTITGQLQTLTQNGVAHTAKADAMPVLVCRYEVSSQVDTDEFFLTASHIEYTDADGNIQYSRNENILTVNATIEELPVNPSLAIDGPLICEEGAYYLMSSTTSVTSGTKDGTYYSTIGTELYALNEDTNGIHLADIHLIDCRTMEEFVLPDGYEIYASGEYKKLGNVSTTNANDATIRIGISGPEENRSEIEAFYEDEILPYGLIGYDSDDGLVVHICQ